MSFAAGPFRRKQPLQSLLIREEEPDPSGASRGSPLGRINKNPEVIKPRGYNRQHAESWLRKTRLLLYSPSPIQTILSAPESHRISHMARGLRSIKRYRRSGISPCPEGS